MLVCLHPHRLMLNMFLPPLRHVPSALKAVTEGRCPPVLLPLSSAVFPTEAATFPGCQGGQGPPSLIAEAMWGPHIIDTNTSERYTETKTRKLSLTHAPFSFSFWPWSFGNKGKFHHRLLPRDKVIIIFFMTKFPLPQSLRFLNVRFITRKCNGKYSFY